MGNPKFIPTQKKVTYSFRIEEENLDKLKRISELNDTPLPKIMNSIVDNYLLGKTIYNTYIEGKKGMFIDLPDITQGKGYDEFQGGEYYHSNLTFEYEVKKIPCNLEYWSDIYNSYRVFNPNEYEHEGIEFLIVPELCEYEERCYTDLTKYLYCIHFLVRKKPYSVEINYISFMEAINKIKKCENYPLLNHALEIKETLEERTEEIESQIYIMSQKGGEYREFDYVWSELNSIAQKFNSGNIIPIDKSRNDIQYKASLQSMTNTERENILKENEEMKKKLKKMDSILERLDELEGNQKDLESKVLGDNDGEKL